MSLKSTSVHKFFAYYGKHCYECKQTQAAKRSEKYIFRYNTQPITGWLLVLGDTTISIENKYRDTR